MSEELQTVVAESAEVAASAPVEVVLIKLLHNWYNE